MKKIKLAFILMLLCVVFSGRQFIHHRIESDSNIRTEAKNNVSYIQHLYNQGKIKDIYSKTTESFRKETSEDIFTSMMNRKKEILGEFNKSALLSSNVVNHNIAILTYRSTYEHYSLIEEFEFTSEEGGLHLSAYFIDDAGKRGEVIKL